MKRLDAAAAGAAAIAARTILSVVTRIKLFRKQMQNIGKPYPY